MQRNRMLAALHCLVLVLFVLTTLPIECRAQNVLSVDPSGGANWCKDSGTYCWSNGRKPFSGLRIIGEPKFGKIFSGGNNRIESEGFGKLTVIGFESNLVGSFLAVQLSLITPGQVTLDAQSPLRVQHRLVSGNGELDVDGGVAMGVSAFDGLLTLGYGFLRFDPRDIVTPTSKEKRNNYLYLNFQAVSAVRALVKQQKGS